MCNITNHPHIISITRSRSSACFHRELFYFLLPEAAQDREQRSRAYLPHVPILLLKARLPKRPHLPAQSRYFSTLSDKSPAKAFLPSLYPRTLCRQNNRTIPLFSKTALRVSAAKTLQVRSYIHDFCGIQQFRSAFFHPAIPSLSAIL